MSGEYNKKEEIEESEPSSEPVVFSELQLKLGDIIQIESPENSNYHSKVYFIKYIDDETIKLMNVNDGTEQELELDTTGCLRDLTVNQINLLSRSNHEGYAKQNKLLPNTHIKIKFTEKMDDIYGKITNLEKDMIEILTNDGITIFIDFEYKGFPKNIPLESITIIEKLSVEESLLLKKTEEKEEEQKEDEEEEKKSVNTVETASIEFNEKNEAIIQMPDNPKTDSISSEDLEKLYTHSSAMVGEQMEILINVEVKESEQRYGIEIQTNDLLDHMLSKIPDNERPSVIENINRTIRRYKELRQKFSVFDKNGNVSGAINFLPTYKPLAEHIDNMDVNMRWIIPVVKQKTKIYESNDMESDDIISEANLVSELEEYNKSLEMNNGNNRYSSFYDGINHMFTPFEKFVKDESIIKQDNVKVDLEAIVENLKNFKTYVFRKKNKSNEIVQKQFVFQRYIKGMSKINEKVLRTGKKVYLREPMTTNDMVSVKSIIMLPRPIVEFSRVDLPGTNILNRAGLSKNWMYYFKLLNNKTYLKKININSVSKEYNYEEKDDETDTSGFLDTGMAIDISKTIHADYRTILNTIIPRSVNIIRMLKQQYIGYNFSDVLEFYEPFLIYNDNLTYSGRTRNEKKDDIISGGPYQEIRKQINDNIANYYKRFTSENKKFSLLKTVKSIKPKKSPIIENIRQQLLVKILKEYRLNVEDETLLETSSEMLSKMISIDNGAFYMSIISFLKANLYTPELANILLSENEEAKTNSNTCVSRVIAKKYTSLRDLQKDNNKDDVYFDKDYDQTPYDLLSRYEQSQKNMSNAEFLQFLKLALEEEHGARPDVSESMAKTIIARKKPVEDGNYAALIIYPQLKSMYDESSFTEEEKESVQTEADVKKRISYFIRRGNYWVKDTSVSDMELNNELFCNVDNKCFYDKNREFCDAVENASDKMKRIAKKNLKKDFATTIRLTMEDFEKELAKQYNFKENTIKRNRIITEINNEKYSYTAFNLGLKASLTDIVVSPYSKVLDMILSQPNFINMQRDIIKFKNHYCREAIVNEIAAESIHWYYCKEKNVKLMPAFLYVLAVSYFEGNYELTLEIVSAKNGKKSDSGDAIIDKHSGYHIRYIDFATEEEYDDQGFIVKTRSVMEKEVGEIIRETIENEINVNQVNLMKPLKPVVPVFEREIDKYIYKVSSAICEKIHVEFDEIGGKILSYTSQILEEKLYSEEDYNALAEKAMADKKGKKAAVPYETYRNKGILLLTVAVTFIIIQTHIPSFKPKKGFPTCIFSLSGYPLGITGDLSGLKYLCCVVEKMKSNISEPWKSVFKLNGEKLMESVKEWIETVLPNPDIKKMIEMKNHHLTMYPDTHVPEDHDVEKWVLFQPPFVRVAVEKKVSGVSKAHELEIVDTMKSGHKSQHEHIGTMYKKIIEHSYSLVDDVNEIVSVTGKEAMMKAGTVVFFENACCEELNVENKQIVYFAKRNENIMKSIDFVKKYQKIYDEIKSLTIPSFISSKTQKTKVISEDTNYSETNIYMAYIHYCHLKNNSPIPDDLKTICQEKPVGLNTMNSEQIIEMLKEGGKKQTVASLTSMMKKIAERNIVDITISREKPLSFNDLFIETEYSESKQDIIIKYMTDAMKSPEKITKLNARLFDLNKKLFEQINKYLVSHKKIDEREFTKIMSFFDPDPDVDNIPRIFLDKSTPPMPKEYMYKWKNAKHIHSFITNSIYNITHVIPSMLNGTIELKSANAMKHWNFAEIHYDTLTTMVRSYFDELIAYDKDSCVCSLFEDVSADPNLKDIGLIVSQLATITVFDAETLQNIYKYCYLSVFSKIISISDNKKYLKLLVSEKKDVSEEMEQIEISDNKQDFFQRVSKLLFIILRTDMKNKSLIDFDYNELIDKFRADGLTEKKKITDRLKNMSKDERNVELIMKQYKMGVWNLGEQKGIYQYDKTLYEAEVEADFNDKPPAAIDVNDLIAQELNNLNNDEANQAYNDIGDDGDYYPEDRDREDE